MQETLAVSGDEGTLDSSGVFTISAEEAARKLGAFRLPTPQSWLLVLIQAANRGKASQVKVKQSNQETKVSISGLPAWKWEDLQPYFSAMRNDGSFLHALATCFLALAGNPTQNDVSVMTPDKHLYHWVPEGWVETPSAMLRLLPKGTTTVTYSHLPKKAEELGFFSRARLRRTTLADHYKALSCDCLASSVPVICDGRLLSGVHLEVEPTLNSRRFVALLPLDLRSCPPLAYPLPTRWKAFGDWERDLAERFRLAASGKDPSAGFGERSGLALCWIALRTVGTGKHAYLWPSSFPTRLCWVQDGVVVERQELHFKGAIGMTVYVNANGLANDISGLALRKSEEFWTRQKEVADALPVAVRELVDSCENGVDVDSVWKPAYTAVAGGSIMLLGLSVGGVGLLTAIVMGAGGFYGASTHRARLKDMNAILDKDLKALPRRLTRALQ